MSETSSTNRIQCPGCNASLIVARESPSPYIRCGVCNVLFEVRSNSTTKTRPKVVSDEKGNAPSPAKKPQSSSPYGDTRGLNTRGENNRSSEVVRITENRPRQTQSGLATFFVIIAGLGVLFYFALANSVSIPGKHSQRPNTYRVVDQNGRPFDLDHTPFSHEINLNGESPKQFSKNTTKISLEGRNFSRSEIKSLLQLKKLQKLSYTGVKIQPRDLALVRSKQLIELNLSQSRWDRGQLVFNRNYYPDLTHLDLSNSSVRGFDISGLRGCQYLTTLNLRGTNIEDGDLDSLKRHPNLADLDLCQTKVTYQGVRTLNLERLWSLKVSPGTLTTSQQTKLSDQFPNLEILVIPQLDSEDISVEF